MSRTLSREEAWSLLTEWVSSESLRRHCLAVEASMRAYARRNGADEELWGVVGLLHDMDYERHPDMDAADGHPRTAMRVLTERGVDPDIVRAIASHADYMGVPRDTPLRQALYGCDELVGFVGACVKVRPSRKLADLPVESVLKKLRDKAFARSVDRACVYGGAEGLGRPLAEHVAFVIEALLPIADELGL